MKCGSRDWTDKDTKSSLRDCLIVAGDTTHYLRQLLRQRSTHHCIQLRVQAKRNIKMRDRALSLSLEFPPSVREPFANTQKRSRRRSWRGSYVAPGLSTKNSQHWFTCRPSTRRSCPCKERCALPPVRRSFTGSRAADASRCRNIESNGKTRELERLKRLPPLAKRTGELVPRTPRWSIFALLTRLLKRSIKVRSDKQSVWAIVDEGTPDDEESAEKNAERFACRQHCNLVTQCIATL